MRDSLVKSDGPIRWLQVGMLQLLAQQGDRGLVIATAQDGIELPVGRHHRRGAEQEEKNCDAEEREHAWQDHPRWHAAG